MEPTEKVKFTKEDKLLTPQQVADRLKCSKREAYDLIAAKYFILFYPNGPGRRPVRVWESSLVHYIESFSVSPPK